MSPVATLNHSCILRLISPITHNQSNPSKTTIPTQNLPSADSNGLKTTAIPPGPFPKIPSTSTTSNAPIPKNQPPNHVYPPKKCQKQAKHLRLHDCFWHFLFFLIFSLLFLLFFWSSKGHRRTDRHEGGDRFPIQQKLQELAAEASWKHLVPCTSHSYHI